MGLFEYRQTAPLYQKVLYTHKAEVDAIAQQKSLSQNNFVIVVEHHFTPPLEILDLKCDGRTNLLSDSRWSKLHAHVKGFSNTF